MRSLMILLGLFGLAAHVSSDPTWPSPATDELEEIIFQLTGAGSRHFADVVSPCTNEASGPGRLNAAEWLRTAFHDMSTGNTFFGTGGLDASLQYELENSENTGPGHRTTLQFMGPYVSRRSSLSDLLAAGVYMSVRSCGGPIVPIRAGRKDATARGSTGVPQPQNSVLTFQQQFERMGFTNEEMIQVTACGHTIGGVHSVDFPELLPAGSTDNGMGPLDSSEAMFDNRVVTEYLDGTTKNPLVVGPAVRLNKHADFKVFNSDGNVTMKKLADADEFRQACKLVLQKMIDVVPPSVELTKPIEPYSVKPVNLQLTLTKGGTALQLTGFIRIKVTGDAPKSVTISYKNHAGKSECGSNSCQFQITSSETGKGFDNTFAFFPIEAEIPAKTGVSSFTINVQNADGSEETFDNNGEGYPLQDDVIFQTPQSCVDTGSGALTIVAAVRNGAEDADVEASISYKVTQTRSPIPNLKEAKVVMKKAQCVGQYTFFEAEHTLAGVKATEATIDITGAGGKSDSFKRASAMGGTCRDFPSPAACGDDTPPEDEDGDDTSTTTSTSTTTEESTTTASTSTITSAVPSSGPRHRDIVGDYALVSCWTEGTGVRALSAAFLPDDDMTLEMCAEFCKEYSYWGAEYGRECWCGNELAASSKEAPLKDCNMLCAGDSTQYCGAGDRLELYARA